MGNLRGLGIKFLLILAVLWLVLTVMFRMTFGNVFWISVVLTLISYYVGDRGILPRTNNTIASIADFGLAFLTIWAMAVMLVDVPDYPYVTASLIAAAAVTIGEIFFHRYMAYADKDTADRNNGRTTPALRENYAMETAEEFEPKNNNYNPDEPK
ncbi:MAG TPA: YndM family protein [Bacillus sp. (in: firmicutes)]|uniref:YndM family protein n=1 Tax=Bacillus litorisediminis TaxID=2922713 RepID=UPI001FAEEA9E|nr:YndM family protein [Bacillus litorisediminis]HWO74933.1 YndM family protein [Bacillus sp. (in: firmicutes)]